MDTDVIHQSTVGSHIFSVTLMPKMTKSQMTEEIFQHQDHMYLPPNLPHDDRLVSVHPYRLGSDGSAENKIFTDS